MGEEFWINPGGLGSVTTVDGTKSYLDKFPKSIEIALKQLKDVKKFLTQQYPHIDLESLEYQKYEILQVNYNLNVETGFKNIYSSLQKFAAALLCLQKKADNIKLHGDILSYIEKLKETKINMIQLLCSIQLALLECNHAHCEDIENFRYNELPLVITRGKHSGYQDIIIFRDYEKFLNKLLNEKDNYLPFINNNEAS